MWICEYVCILRHWGVPRIRSESCVTNHRSRTFVNNLQYVDWLNGWIQPACVFNTLCCARSIHQTLLFTIEFKLNFKWINVVRPPQPMQTANTNTAQHICIYWLDEVKVFALINMNRNVRGSIELCCILQHIYTGIARMNQLNLENICIFSLSSEKTQAHRNKLNKTSNWWNATTKVQTHTYTHAHITWINFIVQMWNIFSRYRLATSKRLCGHDSWNKH